MTKYRKKCMSLPIRSRIGKICKRLLEKQGCELKEFNGEEDHVHLLIELNPKITPSKLINSVKTVTSRLIRKEFEEEVKKHYRKRVFWSRSYCLITCGGAPLQVIKRYIENQGATLHHPPS